MLNGECKAGKKHREIFEIFHKYFMKYFRANNFMKFYTTIHVSRNELLMTCRACHPMSRTRALDNFVVTSRDTLEKLNISKFSPRHGTHYFT